MRDDSATLCWAGMSTIAERRTTARRTRTKAIISYAEYSDSELEEDDQSERTDSDDSPKVISRFSRRAPKRQRPIARRKAKTQTRRDRCKSKKRKQRLTISKRSAIPVSVAHEDPVNIPPWQSLPYHILVQIFKFSSYPLYDENNFQPLPSGRWLLSVALMCRAFADPAFTVLYSSPPLVPMAQAHMLVDLLKINPLLLAFKYRQKVVSLQIEVGQVAVYTLRRSGHLDFYGLVRDLPRLRDLEFYHQRDMSPYRDLEFPIRWTYPDSIFEALEYIDPAADGGQGDKTSVCKLRSWRWSSRLAGKKWPLDKLIQVHNKASFRSLKKIAFVNYQVLILKDHEEDPDHESILAQAINTLTDLEHLIFESSTLLNLRLLLLLPQNLRCLELINCWEVTSDDFAEFLVTHGYQLRCLKLDHNQSLNLAFLPVLGKACPELQILRVNMTFFNIHSSYRETEPIFDYLLLPDQVPSWPKKLQIIELTQLRKWERKAAEMFFSSLLDSAAELVDLRRLCIQAILNVSWRDRAYFRDRWVGSLNRVFKRNVEPPMPIHTIKPNRDPSLTISKKSSMNLAQRSLSISSEPWNRDMFDDLETQNIISGTFPRRSLRSTARAIPLGKYVESSSESEEIQQKTDDETPPLNSMQRRLMRELKILKATGGIELPSTISSPPETPSGDSDSHFGRNLENSFSSKGGQAIQGMCDSVEIRIDNLRPVENQITEADFVDEEPSGDEDWNSEGDEGQWAFEGINHI